MATTEDTTVSLSKLFSQGQEMQHKIQNSQKNSNSAEYQVNAVRSNILVQGTDSNTAVALLDRLYLDRRKRIKRSSNARLVVHLVFESSVSPYVVKVQRFRKEF